ncbi:hypothetical protein M407DRAFT_5083 [Tulasnella calospora MUT 4182]|uniref:Uncharacterized protein n=1 Tax=Tulasnella calospora MUT 4182 TaxID=1051891 RepID=A0A0C3QRR8_9AGAM|nr:hypothetical protein M407DRAFT_5083 [Tulasnella calospora MUT 4182]
MFLVFETPLEAAELSAQWDVDERTILTTQLLDTLILAISQQVMGSARTMTDLNSLANNLLPLSRKHSENFEAILEDLTWNAERLSRYYKAFAEAVNMHPKTDFRIEVFSRVFEARRRLFCFLKRQMPTLMASRVVSTLRDWFNPSTETDATSFLEKLHCGALRDTQICRNTLQEVKALREIWMDISAWLSNLRFEEPGHGHWLWSTDGSPQTNASQAYKAAQRIVALMDDHERTLRQLYTFLGKFVVFRDVATKDTVFRPIERSEYLHPRWSQLSLRIYPFRQGLYVISHEVNSYGPRLIGPCHDIDYQLVLGITSGLLSLVTATL